MPGLGIRKLRPSDRKKLAEALKAIEAHPYWAPGGKISRFVGDLADLGWHYELSHSTRIHYQINEKDRTVPLPDQREGSHGKDYIRGAAPRLLISRRTTRGDQRVLRRADGRRDALAAEPARLVSWTRGRKTVTLREAFRELLDAVVRATRRVYGDRLVAVAVFLSMVSRISYLVSVLEQLATMAPMGSTYFGPVLKVIGIAYLATFGAEVCRDAGEGAIAAKIEFAGKVLIMIVAMPIVVAVLETILRAIP